MKDWLKHNLFNIPYIWIGIISFVNYLVDDDNTYLIAALLAPIAQHHFNKCGEKQYYV